MLGHVVEPLATNDQNTLLLQYYIDLLSVAVRFCYLHTAMCQNRECLGLSTAFYCTIAFTIQTPSMDGLLKGLTNPSSY